MTEQEKRAILERYQSLDREINWSLERMAQWKAFSTRVTAGYSATAGRTSGHADRIQLSYDKLEALTEKINADIDRLVDLRTGLEQAVSRIPEATARILLWERYINGKTWEQVAEALCYCTKQVMRIHAKALQELVLPEELLSYI